MSGDELKRAQNASQLKQFTNFMPAKHKILPVL